MKKYDVKVFYIASNKEAEILKKEMKFALGETVMFNSREGEKQREDAITQLDGKKFEILGATIHIHTDTKHESISYIVKPLEHIPYTKELKSQNYINFNKEEVHFNEFSLGKVA